MTQPNGITQDGNSLVISNCTLRLENAFDPTSGAVVFTITPAGGFGTLPGLLQGDSGPSSSIRNIIPHYVPYGTALPNPSVVKTVIVPAGQPGVSEVIDIDIWIPSGQPGQAGSYSIAGSTDLGGTQVNNSTLIWNTLTDQFEYAPLYLGATYWPSSITSTSGFTAQGTPRTLTTISVPALPFAWTPYVSGQCVITGTVNTVIELSANIGSTTGQQVGVGYGVAGQAIQNVSLQFGIPSGSASGYGQVPANSSTTIVLSATQTASTTDSWSTNNLTTSFAVSPNPVPPS